MPSLSGIAEHICEDGVLAKEITPVTIPQRKGDPVIVSEDELPAPADMLATLHQLGVGQGIAVALPPPDRTARIELIGRTGVCGFSRFRPGTGRH